MSVDARRSAFLRSFHRSLAIAAAAASLLALSGGFTGQNLLAQGPPPGGRGDGPPPMKNLQIFPANTPRDEVLKSMREFTRALGVGCDFCHVDEHEGPNPRDDKASDEKPEKVKARAMMTMTKKINADLLTAIPNRETPPVSVRCITCHHGLPLPETLAQHLGAVLTRSGIDSVKAEYKMLREDLDRGRYDFGEQSLNDWARSLSGEGKNDEALAVLALNQEFFPQSNYIPMMQAEVHAAKGEKDIAIELLKKVVAADPENERAARRLKDLQSGGK